MTNLEFSFDSRTLTCTSVGGPASEITWLRNGMLVPTSDSEFQFHQRIMDSESATYLNILTGTRLGIFLGEFTCVVRNVRGESNQSLLSKGIIIRSLYKEGEEGGGEEGGEEGEGKESEYYISKF